MKTKNDKGLFYWFGIPVKAYNFRIDNTLGLTVCDLMPVDKWPSNFSFRKTHVVYSLLRTDPRPDKAFYIHKW